MFKPKPVDMRPKWELMGERGVRRGPRPTVYQPLLTDEERNELFEGSVPGSDDSLISGTIQPTPAPQTLEEWTETWALLRSVQFPEWQTLRPETGIYNPVNHTYTLADGTVVPAELHDAEVEL